MGHPSGVFWTAELYIYKYTHVYSYTVIRKCVLVYVYVGACVCVSAHGIRPIHKYINVRSQANRFPSSGPVVEDGCDPINWSAPRAANPPERQRNARLLANFAESQRQRDRRGTNGEESGNYLTQADPQSHAYAGAGPTTVETPLPMLSYVRASHGATAVSDAHGDSIRKATLSPSEREIFQELIPTPIPDGRMLI